jgi:hypothetical protein
MNIVCSSLILSRAEKAAFFPQFKRVVFNLVAIIEKVRFSVESRVQQLFAWIQCHFESFIGATSAEDETTQSTRVFCLVSLMLFFLLILLSPDKIPQVLAPAQIDSEILGKAQCVVRALRRLMPI